MFDIVRGLSNCEFAFVKNLDLGAYFDESSWTPISTLRMMDGWTPFLFWLLWKESKLSFFSFRDTFSTDRNLCAEYLLLLVPIDFTILNFGFFIWWKPLKLNGSTLGFRKSSSYLWYTGGGIMLLMSLKYSCLTIFSHVIRYLGFNINILWIKSTSFRSHGFKMLFKSISISLFVFAFTPNSIILL